MAAWRVECALRCVVFGVRVVCHSSIHPSTSPTLLDVTSLLRLCRLATLLSACVMAHCGARRASCGGGGLCARYRCGIPLGHCSSFLFLSSRSSCSAMRRMHTRLARKPPTHATNATTAGHARGVVGVAGSAGSGREEARSAVYAAHGTGWTDGCVFALLTASNGEPDHGARVPPVPPR